MKGAVMRSILLPICVAILGLSANAAMAAIVVQCPGDTDGDAIVDVDTGPGQANENVRCMHVIGGDGLIKMGDGKDLYIFSFSDMTGRPEADVMTAGALNANFPAPTIELDQGTEFYLSVSNAGMILRPDLEDPHSVHYHGFPNASAIFDGLPETSVSINQANTLTYYYNNVEPGTYIWHCHVEATEHMQMGMLGNLYVRPKQNKLPAQSLNGFPHVPGNLYAYNDGDGSTHHDVNVAMQIGSFDGDFHDASETVQPLPFAEMKDRYPMLNGRGYPDTINPNSLFNREGKPSQKINTIIEANSGKRILLRISNLNVTNFYTLSVPGIPMQVVGRGARILRGGGKTTGIDLYYKTTSVTLGGGETRDVILDTAGITPGTYVLQTTNFNFLSNAYEDFGGMMTEIVIN